MQSDGSPGREAGRADAVITFPADESIIARIAHAGYLRMRILCAHRNYSLAPLLKRMDRPFESEVEVFEMSLAEGDFERMLPGALVKFKNCVSEASFAVCGAGGMPAFFPETPLLESRARGISHKSGGEVEWL